MGSSCSFKTKLKIQTFSICSPKLDILSISLAQAKAMKSLDDHQQSTYRLLQQRSYSFFHCFMKKMMLTICELCISRVSKRNKECIFSLNTQNWLIFHTIPHSSPEIEVLPFSSSKLSRNDDFYICEHAYPGVNKIFTKIKSACLFSLVTQIGQIFHTRTHFIEV